MQAILSRSETEGFFLYFENTFTHFFLNFGYNSFVFIILPLLYTCHLFWGILPGRDLTSVVKQVIIQCYYWLYIWIHFVVNVKYYFDHIWLTYMFSNMLLCSVEVVFYSYLAIIFLMIPKYGLLKNNITGFIHNVILDIVDVNIWNHF